jgi:hypothetical protein
MAQKYIFFLILYKPPIFEYSEHPKLFLEFSRFLGVRNSYLQQLKQILLFTLFNSMRLNTQKQRYYYLDYYKMCAAVGFKYETLI